MIRCITTVYNSVKLWAMLCTQDGWVMVKSSDKNVVHWRSDWQTALVFFLRTQWAVWRDKKIRHWKMNLPRSVGVQYAAGEEHRNSCRKNEEAEPEQVRCPVVDVSGGESKVWCSKEQYCIGTWNVRSMNQGKSDVVKQEMARVNIDIQSWGIGVQK